MTRLRALNESSSDDSEEDSEERETIEAQEERAFSQYKKALELRQAGCFAEAEQMLISLLNDDFLADVSSEDQSAGADALARPAVALKYACLKNLGNVLVLQDNAKDGLNCYLQAVELDETDVSIWLQMGRTALEIDNFHLASQAFQEGLRCNPHHWPCLDALLPILYAMNDYLGCLLLVSRTLLLDPQYPQALALRYQIFKEDPSLLENFKLFFPEENDISEVVSDLQEEQRSSVVSRALSLQERYCKINPAYVSCSIKADTKKLTVGLQTHSWENLGHSLLKAYSTIISGSDMSYLDIVEISTLEPAKSSELRIQSPPTAEPEKTIQSATSLNNAVDVENDAMDVDSEQDAKGEDQTEEDVTEASGLEQEDEAKAISSTQQNNPVWKKKKKRSSTSLMDQWSKRRSGRRSGRKVEERDESNLASCFRSLLPDSLLPRNLEAELAKASRRRSLRDPIDLLALGDDSMDTEELCRLLQERDAKDEQNKGQNSKETLIQRTSIEGYFGTDVEIADVGNFVKENGNSNLNIIEILSAFISEMSKRHFLTWPSSLVPIYIEAYECIRKHIPFPCPFDESTLSKVDATTLNASLLYCELTVDIWQQKNVNDQHMLGDAGSILSRALGHTMLLSGLGHVFSTPADQFKIMLRIHWLKAHLFLLQENSPSAICSLQDVLDSLNMINEEGMTSEKEMLESSHFEASSACSRDLVNLGLNDSINVVEYSEEMKYNHGNGKMSGSCQENVLESAKNLVNTTSNDESLAALDDAQPSGNVGTLMKDDTSSHKTENVDQALLPVTPLVTDEEMQEVTEPEVRAEDESTKIDAPSLILPDKVLEEKDTGMKTDTDHTTLKHVALAHVSDGKESSGLGECIVKLEATEESTIDGNTKNFLGNGENKDTILPCDKQESDATNHDGEGKEGYELEKTIDMVPNEDVSLNSTMTISSALQANIQHEPPVVSIYNQDFVKPIEKVDNLLDLKTKTVADSAFHLKPQNIADEPSDLTTMTLAETKTVNLANISSDSQTKINDDESPKLRAIIVADDVLDPNTKNEASESSNFRTRNGANESLGTKNAACKSLDQTTRGNANETMNIVKTKEQVGGLSNLVTYEEGSNSYVFLCNCRRNKEISKRMAQKLLTSLTRRQQLSEIDDLYTTGQYDILASTLTECFKYCAQQADCENPEIDDLPDRATQMAMLLDSLWQLQRYTDCFYWAEACLHESFNRYLNCTDSDNTSTDQDDHQMWATTVERLLAGLNSCLKVAGFDVLQTLPKPSSMRLVQTLTSILCQQLEHSDCSVEMAIECITPWLLLHRVICFEELQLPVYWDSIPSHVGVLFTAHEHMAKKARCCLNEGVLLNLILDIVVPKIKSLDVHPMLLPTLNHEVDQAILCLYGHPKKPAERSKKKLQDHKVHQNLELTWERSLALIRFYEPDDLPTFDSTGWRLSPEEEQLFLRILQLVPSDSNPDRYLGNMKAFLKGSVDILPEVQCSIPEAAWNLYYLLADFYLKTFKWEPASKFYMLDVCVNTNRFDSWAGMALSLGTLMYHDINSCDTFDNDAQLRRKAMAQQCFQVAVDLDPENTTMWIEYGNFAYTTHSLCSRLLKTETESLSMEMFTKLEEEKDKMLNITEKCFKAAEKLDQDEGWLQQYMLGKVAEKRGEDPKIFLQHYRLAAQLLFESNAEYPLTINYDHSQHYAFEAHEVHYRIHASILKHLELMEGKYLSYEVEQLYKEILHEAANGPFMAARVVTPASTSNAKRSSVDPVTTKSSKKQRLEEVTALKTNSFGDGKFFKFDAKTTEDQHFCATSDGTKRAPTDNVSEEQTMVSVQQSCSADKTMITTTSATSGLKDDNYHLASTANADNQNGKGSEIAMSSPFSASRSETKAECQSLSMLEGQGVLQKKGEESARLSCEVDKNKSAANAKEGREQSTQDGGLDNPIKKDQAVLDGHEAADICKESQVAIVTNDSYDSLSSTGTSLDNDEYPSVGPENTTQTDMGEMNVPQDLSKQSTRVVFQSNINSSSSSQPSTGTVVKSLDHVDLINQCLSGIEECLVRYPRHYKSFYRLCHHFYQSKQHHNFRKCRMLLLGDYRVVRLNKSISGLFKSASVNSMFNDVWRMPIDEIDRAGSFASHMSRCVHLLMELLRAQKDHAHLLKLCVFLKRDPEKKEKKYLRDNERCDLSKQALVMCLAAMRECVNETRSLDNVIELYRTVKDGIKEMPIKEGVFKNLLCDAFKTFKKCRGLQLTEDSSYEEAAEFCQKELALRKATTEAKTKAQAAQVQMQAHALQAQAQMQAHVQALQPQAIQMGVNAMSSTVPFSTLAPRFPGGVTPPILGSTLASSMFLPQLPVHRGRGRPPKAQQQLHNAMMNMAHMIGLANTNALVTGGIDPSKRKEMKQQQKQRRAMQPASSSLNPVVSSIIKDRPALSITTLPNAVSMSSSMTATSSTSASVGVSSAMQTQVMSHSRPLASDQAGWQARPRQHCPKPMNPQMHETMNSRGNCTSINSAELHGTSRPKSISKALPGTSSVPRAFHPQSPRPFVPQVRSSVPLDDPAAILSRLPGLQVKQRSHQQPVTVTQQQGPLNSKDLPTSRHQQQPLDRSQKNQSANVQVPKPSMSVSKISAPTVSGMQISSSTKSTELKKSKDASFDVITLD